VDILKSIHVIFIGDSLEETRQILVELRRGNFDPTYILVDAVSNLQSALDAGGWDIVIADYPLNKFNGLEALTFTQQQGIDLPFIIVAKNGREEFASQALKAGAIDYLTFDQLTRLVPIIEREMRKVEMIRRHTLQQLESGLQFSSGTNKGISETEDMKKLAAVIAHDFNNHLAVILTAAAYMLDNLDEHHSLRQEVEQILKAGKRANELNQQLFSLCLKENQNPLTPRPDAIQPSILGRFQRDCILVVEDDESVRKLVCRILSANGYEVLSAPNSNEALAICQRTNKTISLLLTDVIMPGLSGKVLADQLTQNHPNLKVLFMSGYTDEVVSWQNRLAPNTSFLPKPFGNYELLNCVREVLREDSVQ
jgi:DNA-binding NtrC family response regulator